MELDHKESDVLLTIIWFYYTMIKQAFLILYQFLFSFLSFIGEC